MAYSIGGQQVDAVYPAYLHAWEELTGAPGKRLGEMIGKYGSREECIAASGEETKLYIPFPFHYNSHSGCALPLVSLQFHSVQIHLVLEQLSKLVQVSHPVQVLKKGEGRAMTNSDLKMYVDTLYVYLDMEERDRFNNNDFQQLTQQVQSWGCVENNQTHVRAQLAFNHPCVELIWMVQDQAKKDAGEYFDFTLDGKDPVTAAKLTINSLPRFHREGSYFRLVQPWIHHTNIPESKVYCYSFALKPEDPQPSGSLNFSRIDSAELLLDLDSSAGSKNLNVTVFNKSWNVIKFRKGLGGIVYAN
jgi:hypothetical protein